MTSPNEPCTALKRRWFRSTNDGADYRKESGSSNAGRDCVHHTVQSLWIEVLS